VCDLYAVAGKIRMSKVSKAAQKTTQLKYYKNACNRYTRPTAIANWY